MTNNQVIFKYPDQKFVAIAFRRQDNTLYHYGFVLVNTVPKVGDVLFEREVVQVLTDEELLKERTTAAQVEKIAAVAILAKVNIKGEVLGDQG